MKTLDYFLIIGIALLLCLGIYILIDQHDKEAQCTKEPLAYGVKLYSGLTGEDLSCACDFDSVIYAPFTINVSGIQYLERDFKTGYGSLNVNWSNLIQKAFGNTS